MTSLVGELAEKKMRRGARPETGEGPQAVRRNGHGAPAGMPLFLYPPAAAGAEAERANGHDETTEHPPISFPERPAEGRAPTSEPGPVAPQDQTQAEPAELGPFPTQEARSIASGERANALPSLPAPARPSPPQPSQSVQPGPIVLPAASTALPALAERPALLQRSGEAGATQQPAESATEVEPASARLAPPTPAQPASPAAGVSSAQPGLKESLPGVQARVKPGEAAPAAGEAEAPPRVAQVASPSTEEKAHKAEEKQAVGEKVGETAAAPTGAVAAAETEGVAAQPAELAQAAAQSGPEAAAAPEAASIAETAGAVPPVAGPGEEGGATEEAGAAEVEQRMAQAAGETAEPEAEPAAETETSTPEDESEAQQAAAEVPGMAGAESAAMQPAPATGPESALATEAGSAPVAAPEAVGAEGSAAVESAETEAQAAGEAVAEENEAAAAEEETETNPDEAVPSDLAVRGAAGIATPAAFPEPAGAPEGEAPAPAEAEASGPTDEGASAAQLSPAEQGAAMASLAEGGGEADPGGGGGGGGGAIPDQPEPEAPDVSGSPPEQALSTISSLPPAKLASALGSVNNAVQRDVGAQRADLAANPPQMDRPAGSPVTKKGPASVPAEGSREAGPRPERAPAGQPVPTPEPAPLPPAPPLAAEAVSAPDVRDTQQGEMSEADASRMAASINRLPAEDAALNATAGPSPRLVLVGDASPAQAQAQRTQLERSVAATQARGRQDVARPMGEHDIYPTVEPEVLRASVPVGGNGAGGAAAGGEAAAGGTGEEAASIIAQEQRGVEIRAAVSKAQGDMAAERSKHETKVVEEQTKSREEIAQLEADNAAQQQQARAGAQADVQAARQQWSAEQQETVAAGRAEADAEMAEGEADIVEERARGEEEAAGHIEQGNTEAAQTRQEGEAKAETERQRGEQESGGFFGWLASKAKAFFDKIKSAIKSALDAARKLVKAAIEKAKKLAVAAIEKARQVVLAVIRRVGDALIAIGDRLLAAFPSLREKWRNYIREKVKAAEDAVNRLAEALKKGVQKALDVLGAALDAALGLLEKGLLAAVSFVNGVVQGAIKAAQAVAEALGAFIVLIKDIASAPGRWISNLGAAMVDGIKNHLWKAFRAAVKNWFNQKLEEVLGLGMAVWNLLTKGGINLAEIGGMAWEALKSAIPIVLVQILVEKLVAMIVPAAGAVMAIIEGLQAAWGTVSRILQAISRFVAFLKTVKGGAAAPKFADAVAAAVIVVIDFVANWLLRRLRKPAGKVAGKLKAIAQRIMGKIKKAVQKVGAKLKKLGSKIKQKFRKLKEKFTRKRGKPKKSQQQKDKEKRDKLRRAMQQAKALAEKCAGRPLGRAWLQARLLGIMIRNGLRMLNPIKQGKHWAIQGRINPEETVTTTALVEEAMTPIHVTGEVEEIPAGADIGADTLAEAGTTRAASERVRFGKRIRRELAGHWAEKLKGADPQTAAKYVSYIRNIRQKGIPSPYQAEEEMSFIRGKFAGFETRDQVTYFEGKEIAQRKKGSTRPDVVDVFGATEVKRYRVKNLPALVSAVGRQVDARRQHIPYDKHNRQGVIVDFRGQKVTAADVVRVKNAIAARTNLPVSNIDVVTY